MREKDIAYNVNADVAAGRIAGELKAARVLFLTDIAGVLDKEMKLLPSLSCADVESLIDDETITGGMIPKVSVRTLMVSLLEFPILTKLTLAFDDSQSLTFFFTFSFSLKCRFLRIVGHKHRITGWHPVVWQNHPVPHFDHRIIYRMIQFFVYQTYVSRRTKIAQVRQTSVKDSSSPTDVGQR